MRKPGQHGAPARAEIVVDEATVGAALSPGEQDCARDAAIAHALHHGQLEQMRELSRLNGRKRKAVDKYVPAGAPRRAGAGSEAAKVKTKGKKERKAMPEKTETTLAVTRVAKHTLASKDFTFARQAHCYDARSTITMESDLVSDCT
jgi:hypothetical protein